MDIISGVLYHQCYEQAADFKMAIIRLETPYETRTGSSESTESP